MDIWVGSEYCNSPDRILILGESWYGAVEPLTDYIPRWARIELRDSMFSRLFNAASGSHTERATREQRLAWWNTVAFYNFVPGTVGETRESRPTRAAFLAAQGPLSKVLDHLRPRGVWIIGTEQAKHSADVVAKSGVAFEVTPHTASYGLTSATLTASWDRLLLAVRARPSQ